MKIHLLVNNRSEAKLIDEFFVCANKISTFELEKLIDFIFGNSKIVQQFTKKLFVDIIIGNYIELMVYFLVKL